MTSPIHLFLLQGCALINELVQQLFQHFYHTAALELIGIGLWCTDSETLWILLKEDVDTFLSFLEFDVGKGPLKADCSLRQSAGGTEFAHFGSRTCFLS